MSLSGIETLAVVINLIIAIPTFYPEMDTEKNLPSGKPPKDYTYMGRNPGLDDDNLWIFDLGSVPGLLNLDPNTLHIYFKDGKVEELKHRNT